MADSGLHQIKPNQRVWLAKEFVVQIKAGVCLTLIQVILEGLLPGSKRGIVAERLAKQFQQIGRSE